MLLILCSLAFGARPTTLPEAWHALVNFDPSDLEQLVVRDLRLPRTVAGVLAGVAFGTSGAVMQGISRNPLADPGILGINAGAALLVVFAISVLGLEDPLAWIWFALVGSAVAGLIVYVVGSMGRDGATPVKLAIAGAAMAAFLAAITETILTLDLSTTEIFRFWVLGSLLVPTLSMCLQLGPFIILGAFMAVISARMLNAMALGDDVARALGQRVGPARMFASASVILLAGAGTALVGPVGFVGLAVPHAVRSFTGPDYRWIIPYTLVLSPALILVCDIIGRYLGELQIGLMTVLVGGPVFIAMVRQRKMAEL